MADVPYGFQHPPPDTREHRKFALVAGAAATRIEENNAPGRVVWKAIIYADPANTQDIKIGPDQNADMYAIGAGDSFVIPSDGGPFTLGNWWVKSASGGSMNAKVQIQADA